MEESIFQPYLGTRSIFKMDREILRPSYIPERLPHRESHIDQLAQILVTALKGERPSNVLIFGKTGTGIPPTARRSGRRYGRRHARRRTGTTYIAGIKSKLTTNTYNLSGSTER